MLITKYNANADVAPRSFGQLFDKFFHDAYFTKANGFLPNVDVSENEHAYEIEVSLPGLKKEDIKLEVNHGALKISGERKWNHEEKNKKFHSVETQYGSFFRSFVVPENANAEAIKAEYSEGILKVELPKDEKKTLKKQIEIK